MRRLSAAPGLVAAGLVFAIAAWWLGGVALLLGGQSADLHAHSAQAAAILVLTQCLLIALVMPATDRSRMDVLSMSLPLWPLLVVLWLTSRLSWTNVVMSQVAALMLAGAMLVAAGLVRSKVRNGELQQLLYAVGGLACAVLVWSAREPLMEWLST